LNQLDEEALKNILVQPRNALVKQYRKMLEMDHVDLEFTDEALSAIAKLAMKRKSGARGLRAIIENVMTDTMYELPSIDNVERCVITEDAVLGRAKPTLIYREPAIEAATVS
ncbi:MAG: ATP-dependent Clp protease ATP-binding subunit ClpX, partial [Clostridia bacterium]|nr:ATP-dependent Clp protease ATP-binding subunit ClpX [Clostridia bacterium]